MDYNEYDGNGNKKSFNFSDVINDKKQRSRLILVAYLILFIVLIIIVRMNSTNTYNEKTEEKIEEIDNNESSPIEDKEIDSEINDMFSFIDMNNYDFSYYIDIDNSISMIDGKRYKDKYSFVLVNSGDKLLFNGTSSYMKAKEENEDSYKLIGFPYILVNYFNNSIIKNFINKSTSNDGVYEITNEKIGEVINNNQVTGDEVNTIKLIKNNNKITQIEMDLSNALSIYTKKETKATLILKYTNFGLIDDFIIE